MATDSEPKGFSSMLVKIIGGISVAVIAPIVAQVGANYFQKKIDESGGAAEQAAASEKPGATEKNAAPAKTSKSVASLSPAPTGSSITPKKKRLAPPTIHLFNGRNLENFQTYLGPRPGSKVPLGANKDPDKVFSIRLVPATAKNPAHSFIVISGKEEGVLETKEEYENYHLTVEYQWDESATGEGVIRHSGVAFHCVGAAEPSNGQKAGYRCWISDKENARRVTTGDLGVHSESAHMVSMMVEVAKEAGGPNAKKMIPRYSPGAPSELITKSRTVRRLAKTEPPPKSPGYVPSPWHTIELECAGDRVIVAVDGKIVVKATELSQTRGRIQLISGRAPIFFRKVDLRPLPK